MSIKDMTERAVFGTIHQLPCQGCGAKAEDTFVGWNSQQGAYLCTDCTVKAETAECMPALFCCIGVPILVGVLYTLTVLGLSVSSNLFIGIGVASLAAIMLPLWKLSEYISSSYWKS